eukprot:1933625-Alexandrium_andersonii.AAC.1
MAPARTWCSSGSSCATTMRIATSAASLRFKLVSVTRPRRCSRSDWVGHTRRGRVNPWTSRRCR